MTKNETESSELNEDEYESSNSDVPPEVVIPRKITLFRVVMERKLGIDWEHSQNSSVTFKSLQTNQMMDGVAEAENSEFSIDESYRPTKKSGNTAAIDSKTQSRNPSVEQAK